MKTDRTRIWEGALLGLVLLYGGIVTAVDLDFNSVFIDEAFHITIGREVLAAAPCPGCPAATGSVAIHPVLAALGDRAGGLRGARAVSMAFGLALAVVVYIACRLLFGGRVAVIAAALFTVSGQTLYLMKLATYDMVAAFFLGLGFLMLVVAGKATSERTEILALVASACALFFASATKYLLPVFLPVLALYAIVRHRPAKALAAFIAPLAALAAFQYFTSAYPPGASVLSQIEDVRTTTQIPLPTLASWTFRWVALAYLLAVFGCFHERGGRAAALLICFSLPIILVHLVTGAEQSVNKNMLFALVFLAGASALGVDHLGQLFSMKSGGAVRTFFTAAIFVIVWAYGTYNARWLERQYPDVSPIISFLERRGFDGMTVGLTGWDDVIYSYSLGSRFPNARFVHVDEPGRLPSGEDAEPDFLVCEDDYYGRLNPCSRYQGYLDSHYALLEEVRMELSWGAIHARILGRK